MQIIKDHLNKLMQVKKGCDSTLYIINNIVYGYNSNKNVKGKNKWRIICRDWAGNKEELTADGWDVIEL